MRQVVKRISLDPARADPGRLDRARRDRDRARADPRPRDRQLGQPRGRPRQARHASCRSPSRTAPALIALTIDEVGMAKTAERKLEIAQRINELRLRRARPRPRAADLRLPDLHADHRRRGVAAVGGRDDRGHPPDQGRACPASRPRSASPTSPSASGRRARAVLNSRLPAPLRRGRARPRDGQPEPHHALRRDPRGRARARRRPGLQPPRGRARALHRPLRVQGRRGGGREAPTRPTGMEPEEALHFHILRRKKDGVEDWIDRSVEKIGAVPTLNDGAAAGDEGGRRQVRRRRADPAVRAAVGRGDEARRRAARALPRQARGLHQGHGRGRDRVRRRARHRQVAGQHDPHQQRLHGRRPRQAGADRDDPRRGQGARRHRDRAVSALLVSTSKQMPLCIQELHDAGPRVPGADRRRGDQPRLRPARPLPRRARVRRGLRAGVFYCKDAFEGLAKMDQLVDDEAREALVAKTREAARGCARRAREPEDAPTDHRRLGALAPRAPTRPMPEPPFWGVREIDVDRSTRSTTTSTPTSCSSSTGAGAASRARRGAKLVDEDFRPRLERMWREQDYLHPRALARLLPVLLRGQRARRARPRGPRDASSSASSSRASPSTTASAWPTSTARRTAASSTSSRCRRSPPATRSPS